MLSATAAQSQTDRHSIEASNIELTRTANNVTLIFNLHAGAKATGSQYSLVVTPTIRNGNNSSPLPSIIIQGKRAKIAAERHELATGLRHYQQEPVYMTVGSSTRYSATIPYENWMNGGQVVLEGVNIGCCSSTESSLGLLASNILSGAQIREVQIVEASVAAPVGTTTGDRLAAQYSFISPISAFEEARKSPDGLFDYNMPLNLGKGLTVPRQGEVERFINQTREGSMSVYFHQGKYDIDRDFSSNSRTLVEMITAVRTLITSNDSRIVRIVIAGFASPEGSLAVNDRLAWDRAVAVKNFLTANSNIRPETIHIYNGSVDWIGLRELVARSDIYQKYQIMDIIDHSPVWDSRSQRGRLSELMRLDRGNPYRYMLRNFFPQLRQAAYIKIYYENK